MRDIESRLVAVKHIIDRSIIIKTISLNGRRDRVDVITLYISPVLLYRPIKSNIPLVCFAIAKLGMIRKLSTLPGMAKRYPPRIVSFIVLPLLITEMK